MLDHANRCIALCRSLALHTEEPGFTTRTFLSEPMRNVHLELRRSLETASLTASIDAAGNLRGNSQSGKPAFYIGSHLDTVPRAGAFDGILGVVLAVKLAELAQPRNFRIEVLGFSEEEGVRFGFPFIGSLALIGELTETLLSRTDSHGVSVASAISAFGLDTSQMASAIAPPDSLGFLEIHIEQGPVLESRNRPLGIVEAISGQTRMELTLEGKAGHAGTTPMNLRQDALTGAAEWIAEVEQRAKRIPNLVATVGRIEAFPGAPNVIPGRVKLTLDVRHREDGIRHDSVERLLASAAAIAGRRCLQLTSDLRLDQPSVAMDPRLTDTLGQAVARAGHQPHRMTSGAGHDAMILSRRMPAAMLFVRSPGGLSHHPDESVLPEDVAAALAAGLNFIGELERGV